MVLCSVTIIVGALCPSTTSAITADEIINGLEQREQSIKTIHGEFDVWAQIRTNDGNTEEIEKQYEWTKNGNTQKLITEYKMLPERLKPKEQNNICPTCPNPMKMHVMANKEIRLFDGQTTQQFLPESNSAAIFPGDQIFFAGKVPEDWLMKRIKRKSLSVFLKQQDNFLKYTGDINLEGQRCHILEFSDHNTYDGKLYIVDGQKLFTTKFEINIINHNLPFNTREEDIFSDFKSYGNITLPSKVTVTVYDVYPEKEQLSMKEIFTVKKLEINGQITNSDLSMRLPVGTRVHDSVANKDFVVH